MRVANVEKPVAASHNQCGMSNLFYKLSLKRLASVLPTHGAMCSTEIEQLCAVGPAVLSRAAREQLGTRPFQATPWEQSIEACGVSEASSQRLVAEGNGVLGSYPTNRRALRAARDCARAPERRRPPSTLSGPSSNAGVARGGRLLPPRDAIDANGTNNEFQQRITRTPRGRPRRSPPRGTTGSARAPPTC